MYPPGRSTSTPKCTPASVGFQWTETDQRGQKNILYEGVAYIVRQVRTPSHRKVAEGVEFTLSNRSC